MRSVNKNIRLEGCYEKRNWTSSSKQLPHNKDTKMRKIKIKHTPMKILLK